MLIESILKSDLRNGRKSLNLIKCKCGKWLIILEA